MPTSTAKPLLQLPARRPWSVVILVLGLTGFFAAQILDPASGELRLRIDPSVAGLLPSDTPGRLYLEELERTFGEREPVIVALGIDAVFEADGLRMLEKVTQNLSQLPGVVQVVSLSTVDTLRSEAGETIVEPLASRISEDPGELRQLREEILSNRIYSGNLVSKDGGTAAVIVYFDDEAQETGADGRLQHEIGEAVRTGAPGTEFFVTGAPFIKAATAELLLRDFTRILPMAALAIVLIAIAVFRTVSGVVVSCSGILIGVLWVLGGLALLDRPLNLVTIIVPPLLLSVGFAYVVHVVSHYTDEIRKTGRRKPRPEVLRETLRTVALPIVLTGVTTIAGFLSLAVSPFVAVREFGFIAVAGVALTVLLSLTYAPALLVLFPAPAAVDSGTGRRNLFEMVAMRLAGAALENRALVLGLGAAVLVLSIFGATQIRVNTEIIENFPVDHPVRTGFMAVSERLGGGNAFHIVFEADDLDAFVDPENLARVDAFENWLESQPEVGSATSFLDHLKLIHRVFRDDDPAFETIPERAALSKQLLLLGGTRDLVSYTDSGYQTINIHVRARAIDTESLGALLKRIENRLEAFPPEIRSRITGSTVLLASAIDQIAAGQLQSLTLAFAFIFVILALLFMSLRIGAVALIPNALPVAAYFGLLGFSGIPLDTTTGLLACIVLGIAVDDTIHFLTHFNHEARERASEIEGARQAVRFVARPVSITTIALCVGLLVLTASDLQNQVRFGTLGAATLAFAWLVDLTFTPALCSRLKIVTLWDLLSFDLGAAPQDTIPLFSGLSDFQARIVALATSVVTLRQGQRVFREGEDGDELLVVIEGELEASRGVGDHRVVLQRMGRGDVVGEIALFHQHTRTADVVVLSSARAIRLTESNLERLRKRYPRIGARLLWNLASVLAERLVATTPAVRSG